MHRFENDEMSYADREVARRDQMIRDLQSDMADLVEAGEMTDIEANEWVNRKADQWANGLS